jgi:hypothetical protein
MAVNHEKENGTTKLGVTVSPSLNETKGPLDKKIYHQILLPNGLCCLLKIKDLLALSANGMLAEVDFNDTNDKDDDDDESDDSWCNSSCSFEDELGIHDMLLPVWW